MVQDMQDARRHKTFLLGSSVTIGSVGELLTSQAHSAGHQALKAPGLDSKTLKCLVVSVGIPRNYQLNWLFSQKAEIEFGAV